MIDLYYFTVDEIYINYAFKVAESVLLYQIKRPEGIAFPGEDLVRICTDYGTGSAGIGMFLLRLLEPNGRLFYEFDAMDKSPFEVNAAPANGSIREITRHEKTALCCVR
jgi:hypothetical protein